MYIKRKWYIGWCNPFKDLICDYFILCIREFPNNFFPDYSFVMIYVSSYCCALDRVCSRSSLVLGRVTASTPNAHQWCNWSINLFDKPEATHGNSVFTWKWNHFFVHFLDNESTRMKIYMPLIFFRSSFILGCGNSVQCICGCPPVCDTCSFVLLDDVVNSLCTSLLCS